MPSACAALAMAAPTPHEYRPFRFLDLPMELRYMVYELLIDRRFRVNVPKLRCSRTLSNCMNECIDCYYPAMMRVNKRVREEYIAVAIPRMMLHVDLIASRRGFQFYFKSTKLQVLPAGVFSQLRCFDIGTWVNSPHPSPESVVSLICDLTRGMSQLSLVSLTMKYHLSNEASQVGFTPCWRQDMMISLKALVDEASWQMKVKFTISCALCCPHPNAADTDQDAFQKGVATFAVCNGPDLDTFELGGLSVKFLGVNNDLSSGDSNTQVILTGKKPLGE